MDKLLGETASGAVCRMAARPRKSGEPQESRSADPIRRPMGISCELGRSGDCDTDHTCGLNQIGPIDRTVGRIRRPIWGHAL